MFCFGVSSAALIKNAKIEFRLRKSFSEFFLKLLENKKIHVSKSFPGVFQNNPLFQGFPGLSEPWRILCRTSNYKDLPSALPKYASHANTLFQNTAR